MEFSDQIQYIYNYFTCAGLWKKLLKQYLYTLFQLIIFAWDFLI